MFFVDGIFITMDVQFFAICNSYCNTIKVRQKVTILQSIHVCCNTKSFLATISMTSTTYLNCCNICPNITTKIYFVAIHSLYCNKMTNSRNCRNITTILQRSYSLWQYVSSIATKGVLSATKRNSGNMQILLP